MRNLVLGAGALLAMAASATSAGAAPVTGTVDITGSVEVRCEFGVGSALIALGELSVSGPSGGQLNTSVVNGSSASLDGWCNGSASTMTVEAFALSNQDFLSSPPTGFDRVINYTATATASPDGGDVSASDLTTSVGTGSPSVVGTFSSPIDVALSASSTPGGGKLVAGAYQGHVDVTLSPAT